MANPIYRVPVIGPWARRIGQVESILAIPCKTTPEMWIQGFFVNAPRLIWSLTKPGQFDLQFARIGQPHHRKRRGRFRIENIIDAIGNNGTLPGYGTWLFRAAEFARQIGWYMMVIDATTEFAVNWTSTVWQYAGCELPQGRWFSARCGNQILAPSTLVGQIDWGANYEGDLGLVLPGGGGVIQPPDIQMGVAFSVNVKPWSFNPHPVGTVQAWLEDDAGNQFAHTGDIKLDASGIGNGSSFDRFTAKIGRTTLFAVKAVCSGGYADVSDSTISVSDTTAQPIKPDP